MQHNDVAPEPRSWRSVRRRVGTVVGIGLAVAVLSACAGSPAPSPSASKGQLTPVTLRVSVPVINPSFYSTYYGVASGDCVKDGVNVQITSNAGANTVPIVASGQVDVGFLGTTGPLAVINSGKPVTVVYQVSPEGSSGFLVGGTGITSLNQLKGQRIGTLGAGTATYGYAVEYRDSLGGQTQLVSYGDQGLLANALASGQVRGAVGALQIFESVIDAGKAKILVDTRKKAEASKIIGPPFAEGVLFGLQDAVKKNGTGITRFIQCLNDSVSDFDSKPGSDIAATLKTRPEFAAYKTADLVNDLKDQRAFIAPDGGDISQQSWNAGLKQFEKWGISGYKADNPAYAYAKVVNMSYFKAAKKL